MFSLSKGLDGTDPLTLADNGLLPEVPVVARACDCCNCVLMSCIMLLDEKSAIWTKSERERW